MACLHVVILNFHKKMKLKVLKFKSVVIQLLLTIYSSLGSAVVSLLQPGLSCPRLMASRREERDYGALPSEQRSEPCVTVADSPTQPTGFNHVCSPSMFSLFLFHFISLRLYFSLPSSILLSLSLSAQVYWKHFSLVFDRQDR